MSEQRVQEYYVEWRIDIAATSPREAAEYALAIQRDPDSIATVFHVFTPEGEVEVDLLEEE